MGAVNPAPLRLACGLVTHLGHPLIEEVPL